MEKHSEKNVRHPKTVGYVMRRALVLSPNRWDGILEVGIFKFAKFLKGLGFHVQHKNLDRITCMFGSNFAWILPKRSMGISIRQLWEITYLTQLWKAKGRWDLLMCDSSHMLFFANRIPSEFKIYRMNDLLEGFNLPEFFMDEEKRFIEESDLIISAHSSLINKVNDKSKFFVLPNPIDLELFSTDPEPPEPEDIKHIPRPRVIYVGALFHWFDWEALELSSKILKDVSFVIVGPYKNIPINLPENLYLLGGRRHGEVSGYIYHCDVGIIPFKVSPLISTMDYPNKVLEYFAMGLPVVGVYWENFQKNFPEVLFYRRVEEMPEKIKQAMAIGRRASLRKKVEKYSYKNIFNMFRDILLKYGLI